MDKIFIVGAGGHSKTCIDVIESKRKFKIISLIDKNSKFFFNYKVIKEKEFLKKNIKGNNIIIGVGQIKNSQLRKKLFLKYKKFGCKFPNIISKFSYVSKNSILTEGILVSHGAIINSNSKIGLNCIINSKSLIEHDVIVGNHCHISTGVLLNGGVKIGSNTFIGSGVVLKEGINIGNNCVIGAGKTIKTDISSNSILR